MAKKKAGSHEKKAKKESKSKSKALARAAKPVKGAKVKKTESAGMEDIIHQILATTGKKPEKKVAKPVEEVEEIEGATAETIPEEIIHEGAEVPEFMPAANAAEENKAGKKGKRSKKEIETASMMEAGRVQFESLGPEVAKERISVKPIPRIASGIHGLDEMTDGGFEEKSILLINGDPGSGKTIFGLQFLYAGAQRGEAGLYISFGEPREWLYPRMMGFGMDFQELEDKKLFFVIEYQPHEIAKLMQEEGGTIYDIVMAYNVKRIVVDPITPYLVQFENLYDARLALVRFMDVVRKWNATTMLLNEVSERTTPHPTTVLTEFLTDGVFNLIHRRTEEGIQLRGIEIWKLCGIAHMEVARPFAFTKRGMVVYPTERLFAKSR